ncbi:MAG: 23S rRNA pseudouridine1911/1915/1917 synthase [Crocinitomicaceae bacterium]
MIKIHSHTVVKINAPIRLVDYVIGVFPQVMTKNAVKNSLKRKELLINSKRAESGIWIKEGDIIEYVDPQNRIPKEFPLEVVIVFEDDYLLVVNKPSGLVVSGNQFRTLENSLVNSIKLSSQEDALKWAKPVHRLDSATSGLVLLAKTATAHRKLSSMFKEKTIEKKYRAVVQGKPEEFMIVKDSIEGKESESELRLLESVHSVKSDFLSLIELAPKTGRTHQLRIHCKNIGHPIVGDKLYGEEGNIMNHKGLFLSAVSLKFMHPILNEEVVVELDQPKKFDALLKRESEWFNRIRN